MRADEIYLVKRGDTLFEIASKFGVSTKELAERNGLPRSQHIYPGQKLVVPTRNDSGPERAGLPRECNGH